MEVITATANIQLYIDNFKTFFIFRKDSLKQSLKPKCFKNANCFPIEFNTMLNSKVPKEANNGHPLNTTKRNLASLAKN